MSDHRIPIIDFGRYGLLQDPEGVKDSDLETLAADICDAFRTIGFVYVINHGVEENMIKKMFEISKDFFRLPDVEKSKCGKTRYSGWISVGMENLNPDRQSDLKESFTIAMDNDKVWPSNVEGFREVYTAFYGACTHLTLRIFDVLSLGLKLENRGFLRDSHNLIGQKGNITALRSIFYPIVDEVKPGQARCGEHSDYGTITLLFQDAMGGLEVQNRQGDYIAANPVPGAIVVNIGDLMQRWTSDDLKAMKHRVLIPEEELRRRQSRQSIAFFVNPNSQTEIRCLDGSDKYAPTTTLDYLNYRFDYTYK